MKSSRTRVKYECTRLQPNPVLAHRMHRGPKFECAPSIGQNLHPLKKTKNFNLHPSLLRRCWRCFFLNDVLAAALAWYAQCLSNQPLSVVIVQKLRAYITLGQHPPKRNSKKRVGQIFSQEKRNLGYWNSLFWKKTTFSARCKQVLCLDGAAREANCIKPQTPTLTTGKKSAQIVLDMVMLTYWKDRRRPAPKISPQIAQNLLSHFVKFL